MSNFGGFEILTDKQRRFQFWVRNIAAVLVFIIIGSLSYAALTFEGMDVSTPVTCYVGQQIVWEGIARGTVLAPAGQRPWRFVDAVTGEPVVVGAYCESGEYIIHSKEDD